MAQFGDVELPGGPGRGSRGGWSGFTLAALRPDDLVRAARDSFDVVLLLCYIPRTPARVDCDRRGFAFPPVRHSDFGNVGKCSKPFPCVIFSSGCEPGGGFMFPRRVFRFYGFGGSGGCVPSNSSSSHLSKNRIVASFSGRTRSPFTRRNRTRENAGQPCAESRDTNNTRCPARRRAPRGGHGSLSAG